MPGRGRSGGNQAGQRLVSAEGEANGVSLSIENKIREKTIGEKKTVKKNLCSKGRSSRLRKPFDTSKGKAEGTEARSIFFVPHSHGEHGSRKCEKTRKTT